MILSAPIAGGISAGYGVNTLTADSSAWIRYPSTATGALAGLAGGAIISLMFGESTADHHHATALTTGAIGAV